MVLMNFVAFLVFKIFLNLVSVQNILNANNCWHKYNLQNCPTWPHIYFWYTFRINYWLCLIFGSLHCRKCCSFHIKWVFSKTTWLNNASLCGNVQGHLWLQFSVQLFCVPFAIKKVSFCGALFRRILAW